MRLGDRDVPVIDNVWAATVPLDVDTTVTVGSHSERVEGPGPLPGS